MMEDEGDQAEAQREATQFVREYFEDPQVEVQIVERARQGTPPGYLFEVVGPAVTEHKRVRARRYVGRLWVVEFADERD